jgi:hypothetical protein
MFHSFHWIKTEFETLRQYDMDSNGTCVSSPNINVMILSTAQKQITENKIRVNNFFIRIMNMIFYVL